MQPFTLWGDARNARAALTGSSVGMAQAGRQRALAVPWRAELTYDCEMKRGAKYVAGVLVMSFLSAFLSVIGYLWFAGLFSAKFDDFVFAGVFAVSLVPASFLVAILVANTYKILRRRNAVVAPWITVLVATCGGAAGGPWVAKGSPHLSLPLAIEVCGAMFALLSSLFVIFVRQERGDSRMMPPKPERIGIK